MLKVGHNVALILREKPQVLCFGVECGGHAYMYRIAGNFRRSKFSYGLPIFYFRTV